VIEANVRSLRRKLGDSAGSIETVRGVDDLADKVITF
jgi:DNA-binding response OmpR family regulator